MIALRSSRSLESNWVSWSASVDVPGIGPGGKPGDDVELSEEFADDLVSVVFGAEPVELTDDFQERFLDIVNRPFREELALLLETALTFQKLFAVEIGE